MDLLFQISEWIKYYWRSDSIYNTHSPFLYDLAQNVLSPNTNTKRDFSDINALLNKLHKNNINISVNDLGAGSKKINTKSRSLSEIVKTTAIPAKYGRLLYLLREWSKAEKILELGTGTGISTAYLAKEASVDTKVFSVEGAEALIPYIQDNLKSLRIENKVKVYTGNFDLVLASVLKEMQGVDIALLDGNHKKSATLKYFEQILPYLHNDSIVVLDDIRWSEDMLEAWEELKRHPKTTCSVDLFRMGILFFRKELIKPQHISYKY